MTLLSMQDSSSSGKPLICEHCDSGDSAVSRCTNCSVFMCEFCVTAHKRINATKGHQMLTLAEVQKLGSKALVKAAFCEKHTGEILKLFCETCQETICRDCTIIDHREHKYDFVAQVAGRERKVVEACLQKAKAKGRAVEEGLKAVQTMKHRVQFKVAEIRKEVDTFFDEQMKALEYYRANLKHEVTTQGQVRVKELDNQAEVLSSFLAELKSGIDFTNQAIADGDDVKLLSMKKQLTQRLAQLNSSQTQCKPCRDDYLKLQVHQTIWDIKKMATLHYLPFDPQKCTVSMVGGEEGVMYRTLAGQNVEMILIIKDEKGIQQTEGGHQVRAEVIFTAEENWDQEKTLALRDIGNGTYRFSYCPKDEGLVTLSVKVEDQEVRGSPVQWAVYPVLPSGQSRMSVNRRRKRVEPREKGRVIEAPVRYSASGFKEGMHCWKLRLSSFSAEKTCQLEVGVMASQNISGSGRPRVKQSKWSWCYYTGVPWHDLDDVDGSELQTSKRSDDKKSSITSVQDNDVFTVFVNIETKKLIIYNDRSKQTEIFTGVQGDELVPVISSESSQGYFGYDQDYPRLEVQ